MASDNKEPPGFLGSLVVGLILSSALFLVIFIGSIFLGLFTSLLLGISSVFSFFLILFLLVFVLATIWADREKIRPGNFASLAAVEAGFIGAIIGTILMLFSFPPCGDFNFDVFSFAILALGLMIFLANKYFFKEGPSLLIFCITLLLFTFIGTGLFSLGTFCPARLGSACIAGPGFLCGNLALSSNGNLSFTFGQSTGQVIYNVGMACTATTASTGLPNPSSAMVFLNSNGNATSSVASWQTLGGSLSLVSGQTIRISGLKCWNSVAMPMSSSNVVIGQAFSGRIFLNYTIHSGPPTGPNGNNPMLTVIVVTLTTKAV